MAIVWADLTFWMYVLLAIVSWYGFGLFSWWWIKMREASKPYMYVTFTMLGLAIYSTGDLMARYLRFIEVDSCVALRDSAFWSVRPLIALIAVSAMVVHMSWRVFVKGRG